MVLTVSASLGICWGTDLVLHLVVDYGHYKLSPSAFPIAHTLIMFNSAVNPFAYALINHRFREKMKGMICCSGSSPPATLEPRPEEMKVCHTQDSDITGQSSKAICILKTFFIVLCKNLPHYLISQLIPFSTSVKKIWFKHHRERKGWQILI